MQETILAISGKPGLYKLIARGNASLIVEAIDETHRRQPAGARDRVTSLGDVTMYTEADDVPLMLVFQNISDALQGGVTPFNYKQASVEELEKFMDETALPAWDRERVRVSDIRKLVQWYNILAKAGYKDYYVKPEVEVPAEEAPAPAEEAAPAAEAEKPAKKEIITPSNVRKTAVAAIAASSWCPSTMFTIIKPTPMKTSLAMIGVHLVRYSLNSFPFQRKCSL